MSQRIPAIYLDGVFRPDSPVDLADGNRVVLNVEPCELKQAGLEGVEDLLDGEYTAACGRRAGDAPTLSEVQQLLGVYQGSLSEGIAAERDER